MGIAGPEARCGDPEAAVWKSTRKELETELRPSCLRGGGTPTRRKTQVSDAEAAIFSSIIGLVYPYGAPVRPHRSSTR